MIRQRLRGAVGSGAGKMVSPPGISTGALFLIVGILYERRHTREIAEYGGISNVMPVYATITMIMFLSSMGLPLLNGFVGEFTILQGAYMEQRSWAASQ